MASRLLSKDRMDEGKVKKPRRKRRQVVPLEDLAPRKEVIGGAGRILFGQQVTPPVEPPKPGKR